MDPIDLIAGMGRELDQELAQIPEPVGSVVVKVPADHPKAQVLRDLMAKLATQELHPSGLRVEKHGLVTGSAPEDQVLEVLGGLGVDVEGIKRDLAPVGRERTDRALGALGGLMGAPVEPLQEWLAEKREQQRQGKGL